ncbi:2'-5' RNA ligase family protein [Novosphingobium sp. SG720]|uniref:2'-5' RNA ligase family protein n=1 Tax=Novosphingobium sp. SG720 TaxID=2586998 RepID=UPI0014453698|nr:2'-5' RNA ligase family protein [Novosphingobium sp. SG720]NKJ44769.1 2'-5' RNA ligase [Novosphingobium sp. SG720]
MKMRHAVLAFALALGSVGPAHAQADLPAKVSVDIYAIPSRPIVAAVDQASADLGKLGMTTFRARGQAVHATLYLTQYPASALPRLKAAIARLARGRQAIPLAVDGTERTATNWLFLRVNRTPALQRLADEVTLAAEPLRDHDLAPPAWMKDYPAKLPAFERYGSPNVFMQFDPHLTLLANETNPALGTYLATRAQHPPQAQGQVVGIGIGLVDANGQIVKTLAEYRFVAQR